MDLAPKGQRAITLGGGAEAWEQRKGIGFLTQYLIMWAGRMETETAPALRSELERIKIASVEPSNDEVIAAKFLNSSMA